MLRTEILAEDFLNRHGLSEKASEALKELLDQVEERALLRAAAEADPDFILTGDKAHKQGCGCTHCYANAVRQGIAIRIRAQVLRSAELLTPTELRVLRKVLKHHVPQEDTAGALLSSVPSALLDPHPYLADQNLSALSAKLGEWDEEDQEVLEGNIEFARKIREADRTHRAQQGSIETRGK